jgi:hypothetical protein
MQLRAILLKVWNTAFGGCGGWKDAKARPERFKLGFETKSSDSCVDGW